MFRRNQQEQPDAADDSKRRAVIEHRRMADAIPNNPATTLAPSCNRTTVVLYQPRAACAQMLRHEIRRECLADSAEYSLIQPIEDKQRTDKKDVLRQRKAEIGDQEDDKRGEQNVFSAPPVGQRPRRIGNEGGNEVERSVNQDRCFQRSADYP